MKILAFRGAEKFIGAPQARSSNTSPSQAPEKKADNELVVENDDSNVVAFNNEKQLPNKTTLDPEKRKLAGLSPDNISIRYNPQIQIETEPDEPEEELKAERIYTEEEIQLAWMGYADELMDFNSQAASALKVTKLIVLAQNNSVAREIVTDRARFEKMMEKNPAVKTLWERFKLVID